MSDNLEELRAAASKVLAEEAHEFGWHVGTETTTYGTLSHVYTPDRMTDLEAHRIIATNMSDTDAQYLASLHPARLLALLSRLEQAEQAVQRVREMATELRDTPASHESPKYARLLIEGAQAAGADMLHALDGHTKQLGGTPTGDLADVCSCGKSYWPCTATDGDGRG